MKKHWHIFIGVAVVVLAVLIVLGVVFLPRLSATSDMEELLLSAAAEDAQYVMLVDPTFVHEGVLAGRGREVRLEGEVLAQVRRTLSALASDISYERKESAEGSAFCMHLLVKSAEGEVVKVYFTENDLYAVLKGSTYRFSVGDVQAYAEFYATLCSAFAE